MNNERRKELDKAIKLIESAKEIISACGESEQDYADNMPENMQYNSDKHERAEEIASELDRIADSMLEAVEEIEELKQ